MIKNNTLRYFVISALLISSLIVVQNHVSAAVLPDLGTASDFGVLANTTVTNEPTLGTNTTITGNLGLFPGTSITGFPPGQVVGTIENSTAVAQQAQIDARTTFNAMNSETCDNFAPWPSSPSGDVNMTAMTLGPGVYCSNTSISLDGGGTLTLNGTGVYIFKAGSTLTTVTDSNVVLTNGATADNVFWSIGSSATLAAPGGLGTSPSVFPGTVIALTDISQTGGTTGTILDIDGRLIALEGKVTFASSTTVTVPTSVSPPPPSPSPQPSNDSNGGGGKEWATKPTFGVSYQTNEQFVTDGFGYSVFAKTITDNFHTGFAMADIPTDTSYPLYAKGYFANQLKIQEFCFGIPETGKGYLAESCIEVHFDSGSGSDRKITDVKVVHNSNAIDNVSVQHEMASCNATDTVKVCDKTMITIAFAEPLQHSVMMIKGIDWKGKYTETYLNEGFNIDGKQLTDLPTTMIPSPTKYEGLIKVTQSEKYSNIWISDDNRVFERNSFGSFHQINQTHERPQDTDDVKTRTHSAFSEWKEYQAIKAKNTWDASKYVSTLPPSFIYDYPEEDSRTKFLKEHNMLEFARGQ